MLEFQDENEKALLNTKTPSKANRKYELDFFKVICCLLVVVIHSYMDFLPQPAMGALDALTSVAVPGFMMVSGWLLFFTHDRSYKFVLKTTVLRFTVVFLIWYTIYVGEYCYQNPDLNFWTVFVNNTDGWHLWYIKVYIQILICYPIVRCITANRGGVGYMRFYGAFLSA